MDLKEERQEAVGEVWQHEASMEAVAWHKGVIPVPPRWYTKNEMADQLRKMNYCDQYAVELADWMAKHLQLAFAKGHDIGSATKIDKLERELIAAAIKRADAYNTMDMSERIASMTDGQRLSLLDGYCRYCGCNDPNCQCQNDE